MDKTEHEKVGALEEIPPYPRENLKGSLFAPTLIPSFLGLLFVCVFVFS